MDDAAEPQSNGVPVCPKAPPCSDLLDDAAGVFRDQTRWPDHLCEDVMRMSIQHWMFATLPGVRWSHLWPLPLGMVAVMTANLSPLVTPVHGRGDLRKALGENARGFDRAHSGIWALLALDCHMAPRPGRWPDTDVAVVNFWDRELFAAPWGHLEIVASAVQRWDGATGAGLKPGPLLLRFSGARRALRHAEKIARQAEQWWLRFVDTRIPVGGRPLGAWEVDLEDLHRTVRDLRGRYRLTKRMIADRYFVSEDTFSAYLARRGIDWRDLRDGRWSPPTMA